jgi:hypothetical protein
MRPRPENPHGDGGACNVYCQGDTHAILVLGTDGYEDGTSVLEAEILSGYWRWYAGRGWRLVAARRVEADPGAVFATMRATTGVAGVRAHTTTTTPMAAPDPTHVVWLLTVRPLFEDGSTGRAR